MIDHRFVALVAALAIVACAGEGDAQQALEQDGYSDVKITGKDGDAYKFTAKDKTGATCTGTVKIKKSLGTTSMEKTAMCSASK